MKQILIMIVIFIISIEIVNGQNFEPNRRYFSYDGQDSIILSPQIADFKQSKFLLGWQWGSSGRNLDEALNINTYHDYPFSHPTTKNAVNNIQPLSCKLSNNNKMIRYKKISISLYLKFRI